MSEPVLGMDLGASRACVAAVDAAGSLRLLADPYGRAVIPAVVSFDPEGNVLVGEDAAARQPEDPANTFDCGPWATGPSHMTRAGQVTHGYIRSLVMDHMRRLGAAALQVDSRRVVLAVPRGQDPTTRDELAHAAAGAGLEVQQMIPCGVAAAYAYGVDHRQPPLAAVVDVGAVNCECTLLEVRDGKPEVLAWHGDPNLGGDHVTARLAAWMADHCAHTHGFDPRADLEMMARIRAAAEQGKRQLAHVGEFGVHVEVRGLAGPRGTADLQLLLTSDVLLGCAADVFDAFVRVCDHAMQRAGVSPSQLTEVMLVGGTCRIPEVRRRLAARLGSAVRMDVDPQAAAALGAALVGSGRVAVDHRITAPYGSVPAPPPTFARPPQLEKRTTRVGRVATKKRFTAVSPVAPPTAPTQMGEIAFSPPRPAVVEVTASRLALSTIAGFCDEIIPAATPIPVHRTRLFTTHKDGQRAVQVHVCQGQSRRFADNMPLGTLVLDNLRPQRRGEVSIAVKFAIDDDGVLEASARDEQTGAEQVVRIKLPE